MGDLGWCTEQTLVAVAGVVYYALHRIPWSHLLFLSRLFGWEGEESEEVRHICRRPLVGSGQYNSKTNELTNPIARIRDDSGDGESFYLVAGWRRRPISWSRDKEETPPLTEIFLRDSVKRKHDKQKNGRRSVLAYSLHYHHRKRCNVFKPGDIRRISQAAILIIIANILNTRVAQKCELHTRERIYNT